jgi:hypothetical protein
MTTDQASAHPDEMALVALAEEFMREIKDLTPGKKLEGKLNTEYGPDSRFYKGVSGSDTSLSLPLAEIVLVFVPAVRRTGFAGAEGCR